MSFVSLFTTLFKPEVAKLTGYAENPGDAYIDKKKVPLGPGVGEKWLDYTTKQIRQKHGQPDWEPNEYMLNKAKSYSEFPNFRPLEEAVDPKMKKYLKNLIQEEELKMVILMFI